MAAALADATHLPPGHALQRLMEQYWACLSRLARLVADAEDVAEHG